MMEASAGNTKTEMCVHHCLRSQFIHNSAGIARIITPKEFQTRGLTLEKELLSDSGSGLS